MSLLQHWRKLVHNLDRPVKRHQLLDLINEHKQIGATTTTDRRTDASSAVPVQSPPLRDSHTSRSTTKLACAQVVACVATQAFCTCTHLPPPSAAAHAAPRGAVCAITSLHPVSSFESAGRQVSACDSVHTFVVVDSHRICVAASTDSPSEFAHEPSGALHTQWAPAAKQLAPVRSGATTAQTDLHASATYVHSEPLAEYNPPT